LTQYRQIFYNNNIIYISNFSKTGRFGQNWSFWSQLVILVKNGRFGCFFGNKFETIQMIFYDIFVTFNEHQKLT